MLSPALTEVSSPPIPMLDYETGYCMIHYPNQKTGFTTDSRIFNIAKCLAKTTVGKPDADKWRVEESNGVPYSQRKNNDGMPEVTDDGVSWVTQGCKLNSPE